MNLVEKLRSNSQNSIRQNITDKSLLDVFQHNVKNYSWGTGNPAAEGTG